MKIRKPYDKHARLTFSTTGHSLAHQSMAVETDINRIMKKFEKTGVLEHRNTFEGKYGDFTDIPMDYHESMNAVIAANDMFDTIPSKIRRRFGNDPGQFLEFVSNPENSKEMIKLGLMRAPKPSPDLIDDETDPNPSKVKPAVKAASTSSPKDEK